MTKPRTLARAAAPAAMPPGSTRRPSGGGGGALPSQPLGALRSRWRRIYIENATEQTPVNLNAWRVTLLFSVQGGNGAWLWDGIPLDLAWNSELTPYSAPVKVVIGGAMYNGQPVYLNESHTLQGSGLRFSLVIIEEFFDGMAKPNN